MKKPLIIVLCLALLVAFAAVATAEDKTQVDVYDRQEQLVKSVVFVIGQDRYFINNETPGIRMDAAPFVESGRTFVPIRYLSNALGVEDEYIGWESPKVTLDEPGFPVVELAVGSKTIKSDGQAKTMDVAPMLRNGRTYLPARFVAEALGYQVAWDAENQVVICWPKGAEKPDVSNVIDYIADQKPVTPVPPVEPQQPTTPEMPVGETRPFSGTPLNPNDYAAYDGWAIPYEFKQPGASIMEMTVEELRQKPVKMDDGYRVVYDVDIQKDRVYIKQASTGSIEGSIPASIVLAKGKDVSVQRNNPLTHYKANPFTHGYYISLEADPGGGTKIEDVTHIMVLSYNQTLAIKNPFYKGGN